MGGGRQGLGAGQQSQQTCERLGGHNNSFTAGGVSTTNTQNAHCGLSEN